MAQLIYGDREVFSQMLFGAPTPEVQNYINQSQQNFMGALTEIGRQFVDTTQQMFARLDSSAAMRIARGALRKVNAMFQEDVIYPIQTIAELQAAPQSMVPYIMVHPLIRQYYLNNEIDGYEGRYIDPNPGHPGGWGHIHYDILHSGMLVQHETTDTEEAYTECVNVFFEDDEYDSILDEERVFLLNVLEGPVNQAIYEGRDPTSIWDGQIIK